MFQGINGKKLNNRYLRRQLKTVDYLLFILYNNYRDLKEVYDMKSYDVEFEFEDDPVSIEVIGNIYDNKELLKND